VVLKDAARGGEWCRGWSRCRQWRTCSTYRCCHANSSDRSGVARAQFARSSNAQQSRQEPMRLVRACPPLVRTPLSCLRTQAIAPCAIKHAANGNDAETRNDRLPAAGPSPMRCSLPRTRVSDGPRSFDTPASLSSRPVFRDALVPFILLFVCGGVEGSSMRAAASSGRGCLAGTTMCLARHIPRDVADRSPSSFHCMLRAWCGTAPRDFSGTALHPTSLACCGHMTYIHCDVCPGCIVIDCDPTEHCSSRAFAQW
jgi:hypothetical protein